MPQHCWQCGNAMTMWPQHCWQSSIGAASSAERYWTATSTNSSATGTQPMASGDVWQRLAASSCSASAKVVGCRRAHELRPHLAAQASAQLRKVTGWGASAR